ncbi:MAG: hypothetical protein LBH84_04110 [Prevotellaceae bacterium]|jgi:hypothetical protein|nr:hypothetical protein [Prevotellaceae bacterium]
MKKNIYAIAIFLLAGVAGHSPAITINRSLRISNGALPDTVIGLEPDARYRITHVKSAESKAVSIYRDGSLVKSFTEGSVIYAESDTVSVPPPEDDGGKQPDDDDDDDDDNNNQDTNQGQ